jgi:5-formyltetrahydrofolate cyclo-ligase
MRGSPKSAAKQALRRQALAQRKTLSAEDALNKSSAAQSRALGFAPYLNAESVALYSPIENEIGTETIRDDALRSGKSVFYPRITSEKALELIQVSSADELQPGPLGILQPQGQVRFEPRSAQALMMFVPGLAFDCRGNRLGHGKAYYDRLLCRLNGYAISAALAYEFQFLDTVPIEPWDEAVNFVITERRIIDCAKIAIESVEHRKDS